MHDTIETFAKRIDELRAEWTANIQRELYPNSVRTVQRAAASLFGAVTDPIRAASRIVPRQGFDSGSYSGDLHSGVRADFQETMKLEEIKNKTIVAGIFSGAAPEKP
jgi:hypothetical protein